MKPPVSRNKLSSAIARATNARSNDSTTTNSPGETLSPAPNPPSRHSQPTDVASTGATARAHAAASAMKPRPAAPQTTTHFVVTRRPNT